MQVEGGMAITLAERMRALVEITRTFAEQVADRDRLLQTITEQTGRLLGGYCLLGLVSDDRSSWQLCAEFSPDPAHAAELRSVVAPIRKDLAGPSVSATVARTGRPLVIADLRTDEWRAKLEPPLWAVVDKYAQRGAICVPMRSKGTVLGTLAVGRMGESSAPFDSAELDLLQVLADHAAQTIINAGLLQAVQSELDEHRQTRRSLDRSEEKLREFAKMEAVGRLAGGVAHDFNNLLSVVLGYSDCLLEKLEPATPLREDIEQIRAAGMRAAALTRQLLAFSRRQVLAPQAVDLSQVVSGMAPMLRRLVGEDVELSFASNGDLHRCLIDPGQAEQVLMNLVVNARDAMPVGGQVTIETTNVVLDEDYVRAHPGAQLGPHAVLSVTDTGTGMSAATVSRIFEPFFTTKAQGRGTGLGLATVYGIVHQSGGTIWVYSELGHGTTFKVLLPLTLEAAHEVLVPGPAAMEPGGHETVLVVEDDAQVRRLVRNVLQRSGYHVLEAENGEEAELICERAGTDLRLLLTDVVMPRRSGPEVAKRLTQLYPNLGVLYMSGYAESAIVKHGVLEPGIEFIAKPITPRVLLRRVREVLTDRACSGAGQLDREHAAGRRLQHTGRHGAEQEAL